MADDRWTKWNLRIRDLVLWLIGIGAVVNELFAREEIRPLAPPIIAALLGLPIALRADERKKQ